MRNLSVPDLKSVIELAQDWKFNLIEDSRNLKLISFVDPYYSGAGCGNYDSQTRTHYRKEWQFILPIGTKLIVDRFYFSWNEDLSRKKEGHGFSFLTFRTVYKGKKYAL